MNRPGDEESKLPLSPQRSSPDELLDSYWDELSSGNTSDPGLWLQDQGGDAELSSQFEVLSLLMAARATPETASPAGPIDSAASTVDSESRWPTVDARKPPRSAAASLTPGESPDGRLRVLGPLAASAKGELFVAWHENLEREVVVRVLPKAVDIDVTSVAAWRQILATQSEQDAESDLIRLIDVGEHRGLVYLVMPYVPGADLATVVRRAEPVPWRDACTWMRQTAATLERAHRAGHVHGDVNPNDLILTEAGEIQVLDWGLGRGPAAPQSPDYMPPELIKQGAKPDVRSDLYGLGCTFYYLLAGQAPFAHRGSRGAKLQAHRTEDPLPLRRLRPDVPAAVSRLVARLIEKDPARRFQAACDFVDALDRALGADRRTRRVLAALAAGATAVIAAALLWRFLL